MSIVIIGGNDCMVCRYKSLCEQFTKTVSHKRVRCAMNNLKGEGTVVARSHSSSMASLRNILDTHVLQGGKNV